VLVRQIRNGIAESQHRGDIVEVDAAGRIVRILGDPERLVTLRSTVKPFGVVALIEAGGIEAFGLTPAEIAIMASSHSGEDQHVRTIQALYRRAGVSQTVLACGAEGMPLDALTAARLARDGERPSPLRHMCSGQHSVFILLSRLRNWHLETYWHADHPAHEAYRSAVARAYGVPPANLRTAIDGCGVLTYAFTLTEVARAFALLADPSGYIFTWLLGYSGGLGSIGGVMIVDYWIVRKTQLNLEDLYLPDGIYRYSAGWHMPGVVATLVGCAAALVS